MAKMDAAPEAGTELEVVDVGPQSAVTQNKIDALIALAEQTDKLGAALDKIRLFVLRRAMPGDFVKFGSAKQGFKVEMTGPGAERVAAALGISFTDWKDEKQSWHGENGDAFTWRYWATANLGSRVLELVEGRASSRSKFFGYENGAWKQIKDVNESDIRTSARRCVIKEGVKLMLGIRSLPFDEKYLKEIGLDPSKIKEVGFKDGGATGETEKWHTSISHVGQKTVAGDKIVYVVTCTNGKSAETFSKTLAKVAKDNEGKPVFVTVTPTKYAPKIESITPAPAEAPQAQPGASVESSEQA